MIHQYSFWLHSLQLTNSNALAKSRHSATLSLCYSAGKRRYDRKQQGFGGQKKPVFHKNVKTTRKVALRLKCNVCTLQHQVCLKRTAHFEIGGAKKE